MLACKNCQSLLKAAQEGRVHQRCPLGKYISMKSLHPHQSLERVGDSWSIWDKVGAGSRHLETVRDSSRQFETFRASSSQFEPVRASSRQFEPVHSQISVDVPRQRYGTSTDICERTVIYIFTFKYISIRRQCPLGETVRDLSLIHISEPTRPY